MAFLGFDVLYKFEVTTKFNLNQIPYIIGLGIIAGLLSVYFTKIYIAINTFFDNMKSVWLRLLTGGIILGILMFFFPSLFGEGYEAINNALHGGFDHLYVNSIFYNMHNNIYVIILLFILVILFKVVATSVTFGAGGVGGIFAPSLFLGSNLGIFYAFMLKYAGVGNIPASSYAFIGMAGLIAANLHAPLTGIFLIAEITGGYQLFLPLMIVSVVSFLTVKIFVHNSVYTYQLEKRGELMTHSPDKNILKMMDITNMIEKNFIPVKLDYTLGDLVKVIAQSKRNIFPVIDNDDKFLGVVIMDDVRHVMFKPELYNTIKVSDLMFVPELTVDINNDNMQDIAEKFHVSGQYNIPVLNNGKYVGFISRANVFSTYRRKLKYFSED
jgi:CIC family chloride channel protein